MFFGEGAEERHNLSAENVLHGLLRHASKVLAHKFEDLVQAAVGSKTSDDILTASVVQIDKLQCLVKESA